MKLLINSASEQVPQQLNLLQLLTLREIAPTTVAVVVNGQIVPRSGWQAHFCQDGDEIEIFSAVAGG